MRKIEQAMNQAINSFTTWKSGNTEVKPHPKGCGCAVYLHGNHIATVNRGLVMVAVGTLVDWPTPTTKSRLRALGVPVTTELGCTKIGHIDVGDALHEGITTIFFDSRTGEILAD